MKRVHIFVSGTVQGVFYRANTRKTAKTLGLQGWVRNLRDGRVEIAAEGEEKALKALIEWCHEGPRLASVTSVEAEWEEYTGKYKDFSITGW
ncbi:MAG: acylphosphatase [Euryarchaeota archaeon]|nr:acylphosphatase [Euryarchaeota archaeon]